MAYTTLGNKSIGSIIKIKINGNPVEFIVVQQGRPRDTYDAEWINGTVLLMKNVFTTMTARTSNANANFYFYEQSDLCAYLRGNFRTEIDPDIRNQLLPDPVSGARSPFPLSVIEMGLSQLGNYSASTTDAVSALFSYFIKGDSAEAINKRVAATIDGYAVPWWTRSCLFFRPENFVERYDALAIVEWGACVSVFGATLQYYVRPAMALPSSLYVSDDGYVTINQPPTAPGSIEYGTPRAAKPLDLIITPATDPD